MRLGSLLYCIGDAQHGRQHRIHARAGRAVGEHKRTIAPLRSQLAEIEVPSAIGRQLDRVAWIWALNSLSLIMFNPEMHAAAIDLAWLGAPAPVAVHVAAAELTGVDHFVTTDAVAASWAAMRGLNVIAL